MTAYATLLAMDGVVGATIAFGLVFAAVAIYRVGRPLVQSLHHRFVVAAIVPETRNVTSVLIEGNDLAAYRFRSGQFVMVRFLCPRLLLESHPYSLSLPYDGSHLRISVKAVGDFSGAVRDVRPGTRVLLEGPYGIFTAARATSPKILCLAFGIGITPIQAIAEDLAREGGDVVLIYGSLKYDEIALREGGIPLWAAGRDAHGPQRPSSARGARRPGLRGAVFAARASPAGAGLGMGQVSAPAATLVWPAQAEN